jgi:hypothetical protein
MLVSAALGNLASEVTHEAFRDKVDDDSEKPIWHNFSGETSFVNKAESVLRADAGQNTDFHAAFMRILEVVEDDDDANKLGPDDIPDLRVDMQLDQANECT